MVLPVKSAPLRLPVTPHLAAAAEVADELVGDVQHRKAAGLVLAPLTDPPAEPHCHDP
jgi:hypothetical protein